MNKLPSVVVNMNDLSTLIKTSTHTTIVYEMPIIKKIRVNKIDLKYKYNGSPIYINPRITLSIYMINAL